MARYLTSEELLQLTHDKGAAGPGKHVRAEDFMAPPLRGPGCQPFGPQPASPFSLSGIPWRETLGTLSMFSFIVALVALLGGL